MALSVLCQPPQAESLSFHPLADVFPLMEGTEFEELTVDIGANGLNEPIVTHEGKILDGRNRYRACLAAGIEPIFTPFKGNDPATYVISANVRRRHLTIESKDQLIVEVLKADPNKSNRQIAKMVDASHPHVAMVRQRAEEAGDVETVTTSIDTKGRRQPAKKANRAKKGANGTKRASSLDVTGWWSAAALAERRHLINNIGARSLAQAIPSEWKVRLLKPAESGEQSKAPPNTVTELIEGVRAVLAEEPTWLTVLSPHDRNSAAQLLLALADNLSALAELRRIALPPIDIEPPIVNDGLDVPPALVEMATRRAAARHEQRPRS